RTKMSPSQVLAMPSTASVISAGQGITGRLGASSPTLSDDSPFEVWYITGRAGQTVTITMTSSDFDSYLHIGKLGEQRMLANDDDSAGGNDAQLTFTFPSNGTYAIVANAFAAGASGSYRLQVR